MKDYGNGASPGLEQTVSGKILTGFVPTDVSMTVGDRQVLRRLAERVAAIAASPRMAETRRQWTRHNRLERGRPMFFCDPENGWNEIITEAQMQCRGKLARRWEMDLRKEIFSGEVLGDDKPVEPYFDVPYTAAADDWGLAPVYHKTSTSGSYVWEGALKDYATDLKKLHSPRVEIDWQTTNGCLEIAKDVFGDLLTVRLKGPWWWSLGLTWRAATFRGLQNMLCDFVEHPDELKELLSIISRGHLDKLDYLEANHLLSLNNGGEYVGSGGYGFSDQLPQPGMSDRVRPCDMWGFSESQETVLRLAEDVRGVHLPLREADHGPFRVDLLRLLRAAARPLGNGQAASQPSPRVVFRVGERRKDGRVSRRQVHFLVQTQSGRVGGSRTERGVAPPGAARGAGKDPGLHRRNHHEGQSQSRRPPRERRHLVPDRQRRSRTNTGMT